MNFFDGLAGTKCLAGMFEIWFHASTKTHWLLVYYFSFCTGKSEFFDGLASTKCLASMFEIWFRASTKTYWLPVYYFFILYQQMQILVCLYNI